MTPTQIAQIAHEANKAYCLTLGDNSQPDWIDAPEWQKSSLINGVLFHLNNPNAKPSDSHESWLKQKEEEGWKYGAIKNPDTKEHPCFVPYGDLPQSQKLKDSLFISVVNTFRSEVPQTTKGTTNAK